MQVLQISHTCDIVSKNWTLYVY